MKRTLGLSAFSLLSLIINVFASAPDNLLSQKLSVSFNVPAKNAIGIHEFFLIDAVNSTSYYFKTSNDSSDSPFWLSELYHYRKTSSTDATLRIISSDGGWVDIMLSFTSSNFASSTVSGYGTNGEVEWTGTADVSVFDLQISEIPSANQPNILATDLSPTSISGGTLSAQDSYWPVYDETISFPTDASFSASITNGQDDPTGSGSYSYSKTGTNSATLSYTIDGAGISFEYALQFTAENTGIYTKFADYGGGSTDITTGPFSLSGVAVPEQYVWEDYDDFSGSTLNTNKWDVSCWDGGNLPIISNGQALLAGKTNSSWNSTIATARMLATNSNAVNMLAGGEAHSVLEFKESDDIYGIELDLILPLDIPSNCGIGIYAIDYNEMFNGNAEDSIRFSLDLWHSSSSIGNPEVQISWGNLSTWKEEKASSIIVSKGTPIKLAFIRSENVIEFFYNNQSVAKANYKNVSESFIVRAVSEQGHKFDTYLDNVRVLRRSSNLPLINVAPAKIEGERDLVYLQSSSGPTLLAGAGEINFDLELADQPTVSVSTLKVDGEVFDLVQNQGPTAFRTRYGYGTGEPNELYDIESSSSSDWSAYANGMKFVFSLTINGSEYTYFHDLPGEAELPSPPSPSISGAESWKKDQDGYDYVTVSVAENYVVSWDPFITSDSRDYIGVSLVELIGDEEKDILGDVILTAATSSYEISRSLLEKDKSYLFYVGFSNVVQSENPTGFTHSVGSNTTESLLRTSANSITALGFMIEEPDPVTVVSDPNGQAVVVQVGNEYQWNSTLDGVTLWSVDQSQSSGDIQPITMRFENGRNFGSEGFYDSIAQPQPYDMPFVIDGNGYIKVSEDNGYQYYHVVSVENGIIATLEGDEQGVVDDGFNVADQWFFTTRAAAEEYYYSKVNPKDWMWFDHYPWVYSNELQEWLYFYPSGGTLMYWSNKGQAWRQFN